MEHIPLRLLVVKLTFCSVFKNSSSVFKPDLFSFRFRLFHPAHTWATEFSRVWVWVRVGYPQLTIYPTNCFKIIEIKFLLFLHVFSFISNEYDKIKCFKKSVVSVILSHKDMLLKFWFYLLVELKSGIFWPSLYSETLELSWNIEPNRTESN